MIGDRARFGAYAEAIARVVRPGDTVLDLGSGPGPMALLACRAGARRVYAIEMGDSLEMAKELAAANGVADRIVFLSGDSRKMVLPERVRVIVSDIRGTLPFYDGAIASLEDARKRFLEPGGVLLPQRDTLQAAIVEANTAYTQISGPWSSDMGGVNLLPGREPLLHSTHGIDCKPEQLLSEPKSWAVLDYANNPSTRAGANLSFQILRPGTGHGICVWFDAELCAGCGYSSGPHGPPESKATIYGQIFLPWLFPVALVEGQKVLVELHADLVGEDYVWRWNTTFKPVGAGESVNFVQSSFWGAKFTKDALRRRAMDYVPVLSESGEADRWIMNAMDGKLTLEEIARACASKFPRQFSTVAEAQRRVSNLAEKFTR